MSSLALFLLLAFLANRNAGGNAGQPSRQPPTQHRPRPVTQRPTLPQKPTSNATSTIPVPTPAQKAQAATQAPPWPQAMPAGLPPFPQGWKPAQPPPSAVVTRAWQLLPVLWKGGQPGKRVIEQTAGGWYTYLGAWMNPQKTMKGVVAYKPKDGSVRTPPRSSSANA